METMMNTQLANETFALMEKTNASLNATMTPEERSAVDAVMALRLRADELPGGSYDTAEGALALEDFEMDAAIEATETTIARIHAFLEMRQQRMYEQALQVYYRLTELLEADPANATLREHKQKMESGHLSEYGRPIPPRG